MVLLSSAILVGYMKIYHPTLPPPPRKKKKLEHEVMNIKVSDVEQMIIIGK